MKNQGKKAKKLTRSGADQLRRIRLAIGYDLKSMAASLGLKENTYQCYEYGQRSLPEDLLERARAVQKHDRAVMAKIRREIDQEIAKRYPHGIPSTPCKREEKPHAPDI